MAATAAARIAATAETITGRLRVGKAVFVSLGVNVVTSEALKTPSLRKTTAPSSQSE
jgi:hypothetical protein